LKEPADLRAAREIMTIENGGAPRAESTLRLATRAEAAPRTFLGHLLLSGRPADDPDSTERTYSWQRVLWLTGVDYFSTLGYQPGIALLAAGMLSVPATAVLMGVTLLCAVPVYGQVAARSYAGQGSIALLEHLLSGWKSKIFVLILLGFASTDFVITMTLSAADAARHAIANPYLHAYIGEAPIRLTLLLLLLLAIVFLAGFQEAIGLAGLVAVPYLLLNVIVLMRAFWQLPAVGVRSSPGSLLLDPQSTPTNDAQQKTKEGVLDRIALVRHTFPRIEEHLSDRPVRVGSDDLLDAAAAAWTALTWLHNEGGMRLPARTRRQGTGANHLPLANAERQEYRRRARFTGVSLVGHGVWQQNSIPQLFMVETSKCT